MDQFVPLPNATDTSPDVPNSDQVALLYYNCVKNAMARIRANKGKYIGGRDLVLRHFATIIDDAVDTVAAKHGPGLKSASIDVSPLAHRLKIMWRCKWTALKGPLREALGYAIDRRIDAIEAEYADPHSISIRPTEELVRVEDEIFRSVDEILESERPEMLHRVENEFKDALIVEMELVLPPKYTCTLPNRRCSV
ncbi:hypothetical protein CspHIS471_0402320 [Cutaneotrichosporon sp. HIS471]|nr:hypothetical protein CspHIS471_0402320 [Cutaneotrichosporon sp. HIS471]